MNAIRILAAAGLWLLSAGVACAAEVKVLAALALRDVVNELAPQFERATGHKLHLQFKGVGGLKQQIDAGEAFDIAILTAPMVDDYVKAGKLSTDARVKVARAGFGIIAAADATKPDIATTDAFRRAMLEAKSFGYSKEGVTGDYVVTLFERLGISNEMKPKLQAVDLATRAVSSGEVQYGLVVSSALAPDPRIQLVGKLPAELQRYVDYAAAVSSASSQREAARAFIELLTAPATGALLRAKGMETQ